MADSRLNGKYMLTFEMPDSFKELLWRVSYLRRTEESFRQITTSFKPSTTYRERDLEIKANTLKILNELARLYQTASSLHVPNPNNTGNQTANSSKWLMWLKTAEKWPYADTKIGQTNYKRPVLNKKYMVSTGKDTVLGSGKLGTSSTTAANALRMQAQNVLANPAAETIVQDIEKAANGAKDILNSYGSPYTTFKGEICTRWLFVSKDSAFKAVSLLNQEYPWIIQALYSFNFFTSQVVDYIKQFKPSTQLYGHLESADDTEEDSPRHLLAPLWSDDSCAEFNLYLRDNSSGYDASDLKIGSLHTSGQMNVKWHGSTGAASSTYINLVPFFTQNTYEANQFGTNLYVSES